MKGLQVDAPDVVWVADSTYIRLLHSFVYLAALEKALSTRDVRPGLIHHAVGVCNMPPVMPM